MSDRLDQLTKELTDAGRLIEAGFVAMRIAVMPPDASDAQVRDMRMAYMSGAQHLFASIMCILDPGEEPTEKDMQRMHSIADEMDAFGRELELTIKPAKGSA